jgi:hypothetical protein
VHPTRNWKKTATRWSGMPARRSFSEGGSPRRSELVRHSFSESGRVEVNALHQFYSQAPPVIPSRARNLTFSLTSNSGVRFLARLGMTLRLICARLVDFTEYLILTIDKKILTATLTHINQCVFLCIQIIKFYWIYGSI